MSYLNYLKMHNCNTTYNIHSIIYERIFLYPIKVHYSLAIKEVFRRYTLYFNNIFYKNFYLIDLCSDEVVLSLESIFDQNKNGFIAMKIPNRLIWEEILFHSHKLKEDYIKKNQNIFQIEILQEFYTKIEIKATYPRLIYIIKFLPLLGGMTLVYEYSQNKMSRIDNSSSKYEEFVIEYGYEFDENGNFKTKNEEILLNEPDVLIHIHFFIIECLLCNLDNINFFVFNKYQKIYFCDEILQLINKHLFSNIKISQITNVVKEPEVVNELLKKIINELYEEYLQINTKKEHSKCSAMIAQKVESPDDINKSFFLSYPDSLYTSKKFTLNTIFNTSHLYNYINADDVSLNLSSEEETSFTDDIYQTLRAKNEFNQINDPNFYYRYHYAHSSAENIRLMDLLYDNISINENVVLMNTGRNLISERNDLMSLNNTELSSRINKIPKGNFNLNPYAINNMHNFNNNYNNGVMNINLNKYNNINFNNPNANISSNSSQITSLLKMPQMNRK